MFKWYQYAIDDSKVCVSLPFFQLKKHNQFWKKPLLGPKKVGRDGKHGTKHVS
jgi:hypothetical protein